VFLTPAQTATATASTNTTTATTTTTTTTTIILIIIIIMVYIFQTSEAPKRFLPSFLVYFPVTFACSSA
jgi:hypothetical protein